MIININDIISDYLGSPEHEKLASHHPGLSIHTSLDQDLSYIEGSPIHIRKSIMNLIANAAEAQPEGGKIRIATYGHQFDRPEQGFDQIRAGDYVALQVTDKGCGISDEDMNRIFEPFYTKKTMGRSGTGLGMAVVWGTVQDHDGHIDLKSKLNEGTTFILYFPETKKLPKEDPDPVPRQTYMGNGQVVLVVDDVKEQRELASKILSLLNYTPVAVPSGEDAIAFVRSHAVDLILLDMVMNPGMDGLETYQSILKIRPNQKAVIASGYAETDRVKQVQKIGGGAYIKKPYTIETLGLAISAQLDR